MKFQTFSVVVGNLQCNAKCPFCVSKMTPNCNVKIEKLEPIDETNFKKACILAEKSGVTTALITGKGEPTLHPKHISEYIYRLNKYFPLIELQTNGILLNEKKYKSHLNDWIRLGLNTIAISIVHYKEEKNKKLCGYNYPMWKMIRNLHNMGYSIRISCLLIKGYIDSPLEVERLINIVNTNKVEQLTIRTLEKTEYLSYKSISKWIDNHRVENTEIKKFLDSKAKHLMNLVHGAKVYDYQGQNVCLTNALTCTPNPEEVRQLIFFPDGHLRYDWQYKGAILL